MGGIAAISEPTTLREFASVVQLLDDESPIVRQAVSDRLREWENELPRLWSDLRPPATEEQMRLAHQLLRASRHEALPRRWENCLAIENPMSRLEAGLGLIADFLDDVQAPTRRLADALDQIAWEFRAQGTPLTAMDLANALFKERFTGDRTSYYATQNSNLVAVLRRGKGNPISLVCLLILTAHRLGLIVGGCNYPGHFLALIPGERGTEIIDCFHAGRVVALRELLHPDPECFPEVRQALLSYSPTNVILLRVLRNLQRAFEQASEPDLTNLMDSLIVETIASGS